MIRSPQYAILSHRWVDVEEVTFQDWQSGTQRQAPASPRFNNPVLVQSKTP
jgi:hypothetical protein